VEWNHTQVDYRRISAFMSFAWQVECSLDVVWQWCLKTSNSTYQELNSRANQSWHIICMLVGTRSVGRFGMERSLRW